MITLSDIKVQLCLCDSLNKIEDLEGSWQRGHGNAICKGTNK